MMTHRKRKLLFWGCVFIFVIVAVPLMFYAFGWRFVWQEGGFARTGGLFVSSIPSTETKIFVDDKLRKETSLLSRSLFVSNVSPGVHQVRVAREGYHEWNKTITVKPELVVELKALLVPQTPQAKQLLRNQSLQHIEYRAEDNALYVRDAAHLWYRVDQSNETIVPTVAPTGEQKTPEVLATKSFDGFETDERRGRLLWWNQNEVWAHWFETPLPAYQSFSTEQIVRTPHDVRGATFYPRREAVLVALSNAVMVVELDGRGKRNIAPLYKGKEPRVTVDPSNRTAFILDDGTLIRLPLP